MSALTVDQNRSLTKLIRQIFRRNLFGSVRRFNFDVVQSREHCANGTANAEVDALRLCAR
jgi:hypothetical protein